MNRDTHPQSLDSQAYDYALNAEVESFDGNGILLSNMPSHLKAVDFPEGYVVVGEKYIVEQDRILYMLAGNGSSMIAEVVHAGNARFFNSNDTYTKLFNCNDTNSVVNEIVDIDTTVPVLSLHIITVSDRLGLNSGYWVDMEYKITNCSLNIYWVDNFNPNRFLYFDYSDPSDQTSELVIQQWFFTTNGTQPVTTTDSNCQLVTLPCSEPIYTNTLDCNKILIEPALERLCVTPVEIVDGNLKAGVYQFFGAYADVKGIPYSDYTPATNPVAVGKRKLTIDTNYDSGEGILLEVSPSSLSDAVYQYYNIAVAATVDGTTAYYLVTTLPVGQRYYTFTDTANLASLTENDVFARKVYYKTARAITRSNDYLFYSGVNEWQKGNWQRVANAVKIYWQTIVLPEGAYADGINAERYRTYLRDEIYPFGLVIEFTNGEETPALILIGRSATADDRSIISNGDYWHDSRACVTSISCCNNPTNPIPINPAEKWRIYNTANVLFTNPLFGNSSTNIIDGSLLTSNYDPCAENIVQWGQFGYHESTECYPSNAEIWGEYASQPIRHFRFPDCSVSHIHDRMNAAPAYGVKNWIFPIGVKIDNTSFNTAVDNAVSCGYITAEMKSRIRGYRLVRGNRVGQQSIIAKGLLYDSNYYFKDGVTYQYPNYPYNDLRDDEFISNSADTYDQPNSEVQSEWKNHFNPTGRYTFHGPNIHFGQPNVENISELKLETCEYGQSEGYFSEHQLHAKYKFLSTAAYVLALSAGVASALTATDSPTECRSFVYKSALQRSQGHISRDTGGEVKDASIASDDSDKGSYENQSTESGTSPYADVTGVGALTAFDITTIPGEGDVNIDKTGTDKTSIGNQAEQSNNLNVSGGAFNATNNDTLNPSDLDGSSDKGKTFKNINDPNYVDSFTVNSCSSTHWQNLNSSGLTSAFSSILGSLGITLSSVTIEGILYKFSLGLAEMKKVASFIEEMIPRVQYAFQYNSVGHYNAFQSIPNAGNKRREVFCTAYLTSDIQAIPEPDGSITHFNNWQRESSLYVRVNDYFDSPPVTDTSRFSIKDAGTCSTPEQKTYQTIASYYGALKVNKPDQYGSVYDIDWLDAGHCSISYPGGSVFSDESSTIFGGDQFICRFALKRKHSFFKYTAYDFPPQGDILYSEIGNVGYPNYYFNTQQSLLETLEWSDIVTVLTGGLLGGGGMFSSLLGGGTNPFSTIEKLLGVNMHRLNCGYESSGVTSYIPFLDSSPATGFKKFFYQKGYIYTYSYGIPYFLCESDVNTDLRYATNELEGDFYPRNGAFERWLQQRYVDPREDNQYHYNWTYTKQNKEGVIFRMPADYAPLEQCKTAHPNRVVYTEQYQQNELHDSWLIIKAANYFDFPFTNGKLVSVDGIENNKILVRFDNNFSVFNTFVEIATNADTLAIGNGSMFASRPQEFSNTDIGHCGSQHTSLLKTEFGHIWVDAKRGKIVMLAPNGGGLDELSKTGMRNWFAENLPFRIKKYFPSLTDDDLDNAYNGIGISMGFDKRFSRIFITKHDYEPLSPNIRLQRDANGVAGFYLVSPLPSTTGGIVVPSPVAISLNDTTYFIDRSWTVSYNFLTGSWVSFYSFLPNYYVPLTEYLQSGINGQNASSWCHGITNRHYQTYYGIMYPFEIQTIDRHDTTKKYLASVEYEMDARRYQNGFDFFYDRTITFNRAIIFNRTQCSGLMNLVPRNENDLTQIMYPVANGDSTDILVTKTASGWRFNQFYDLVFNHRNNIPQMVYNSSNTSKLINDRAIAYGMPDLKKERIRGDYNFVRLINDTCHTHRFIFRWLINNTIKTCN